MKKAKRKVIGTTAEFWKANPIAKARHDEQRKAAKEKLAEKKAEVK